jgi:hypothetical protein
LRDRSAGELIGGCWLRVVWLRVRIRRLAERSMADPAALPRVYFKYYRTARIEEPKEISERPEDI